MSGEFLIETWNWIKKDFDLIVNSYYEPQSNLKSSSKDQEIYLAAIRLIALVSSAYLTISGIKSFFFGTLIGSAIKVFGALASYDIFLIFKECTTMESPFNSAVQAGKGKGILKGAASFGKSILSSAKSKIDLNESILFHGKINVNILTKNTNLQFLWRSLLLTCFPSCFIDLNNQSSYIGR